MVETTVVNWPTLTFIVILLGIMVNPFRCCFRAARTSTYKAFWNFIRAPFADVRFKDFFLGDILTSLGNPFTDCLFIVCFFNGSHEIKKDGDLVTG